MSIELKKEISGEDTEKSDDRVLSMIMNAVEEFDRASLVAKDDKLRVRVQEILTRLENEIEYNKLAEFEPKSEQEEKLALMAQLTEQDKEFIENIDKEYYKRVHTSEDYYKRKKLILYNLDKLQKKMEKVAKNYDDFVKLKFIMMEKARHKKAVVRNFERFDQSFRDRVNHEHKRDEEWVEDDFEQLYGLENEFTSDIKSRINASKKSKGRGLLCSFFEFN